MSSTYAGTAAFASYITLPSDGDERNASSVNVPLETLADRTKFLYDRAIIAISSTDSAATSGFTTTSTSLVDVTGFTLPFTCLAGDKILVNLSADLKASAGLAQFEIHLLETAAVKRSDAVNSENTSTYGETRSLSYVYTVTAPCTVTVKGKLKSDSGAHTATFIVGFLTVQQIRM
jgi:hypothetical protein